jgi:cytochrome c peroxidase
MKHPCLGRGLALGFVAVTVVGGCRGAPAEVATASAVPVPQTTSAGAAAAHDVEAEINPRLLRRFQPVGGDVNAAPATSEDKIVLGRALFHDKRLSRGQDISCNSCHALDNFGIDGKAISTGARGQLGTRNAPTVFNAATHIAQFWDGRAASIEAQASGPIMNPTEMAMPSEQAVITVLKSIPEYVVMFGRAFAGESDPISMKSVGEAIGAFERGLVTRSRWDRFVAGDKAALTAEERRGLRVFLDVGCVDCHTGPQVGGTMFQKVGAVLAWPNQNDVGRMAVTRSAADRMVFKVPTLKNIAKTSPYFHDGSAVSLREAVALMGKHQLGITLAADEIDAIVAWMLSMTGEADPAYIAAPVLPKGGPKTPRPM